MGGDRPRVEVSVGSVSPLALCAAQEAEEQEVPQAHQCASCCASRDTGSVTTTVAHHCMDKREESLMDTQEFYPTCFNVKVLFFFSSATHAVFR